VVLTIVIRRAYADTDNNHVVVGGSHFGRVVDESGCWWKARTSLSTLSYVDGNSFGEVLLT